MPNANALPIAAVIPPPSFPVVGIGASAGGLESLENFFANVAPDSGMAFVVVQHLSPDFRSMMDELLARRSPMPVRVAEHELEVRPNHVYLLPPKKDMIIRGGRLLLTDKEPGHALTLPIDVFFRSLAQDLGPNAVAIVLSGSGSDGSRGVRDVKSAGGRVLVEAPESAQFDGMPMSALATGVVDHAAKAAELPRLLAQRDEPGSPAPAPEPEEPLSPTEAALQLLRDQFGLDFSLYKTTTVNRRIQRRAEMLGCPDLESYIERLRGNSQEQESLYHDLLIGVTRFFRDPGAFDVLEAQVVPELLERVPAHEELRVWVAACATGEEAYSLAMILFEKLTAAGRPLNVKILATDVHRASLAYASLGFYGEEQLEHVSRPRRERFFTRKPGGYEISQELRQLIVFAPHNVTKDAPFTRMHLISCRNMLIYLEPEAQKTVLSLFHFGLVAGGTLFLGASETAGALAHEFTPRDEHWKIYRKRRDVRLLEPLRMSVNRKPAAAVSAVPPWAPTTRSSGADAQLLATYDQLLDRYMPPSFLVGEDLRLLDTFGGAERMFRLGKRRPSTSILDLLEGELRTIVAAAVQGALKKDGGVRYVGVTVADANGTTRRATLTAEAISHARSGATHVLIGLEPESAGDRQAAQAGGDGRVAATQVPQERLISLEGELSHTRETLQTAIEELQTSNEELQAANEELVASNEELQSTNEELHSVNEELYTVNAEYQKKIVELRELNNDMQHFLESTDVATLFLDGKLCIRKYTPRMASIFHIQPQDVGRSIRDFSHGLLRPTLLAEMEQALAAGALVEDEVRAADGTSYFLRVLPYRPPASGDALPGPQPGAAAAAAAEGVVVSLTDISALDRARARVRQLSAIVESSEDAIIGTTLDGSITSWNRGAERLYGHGAEEAIGRSIRMLAPPVCEPELLEALEAVKRGERVEHMETMSVRKDGGALDVSATLSPVYDPSGAVAGSSAIVRDISQLKAAQQELEEREGRIRLLLESTAEAIFGLGRDGVCTFANPACLRILGYDSAEALVGRDLHGLLHEKLSDGSPCPREACPLDGALRTGEGTHSDGDLFRRSDGSVFPAEYWSYPVRQEGVVAGAVVTFVDITARKQAEEQIRTGARRREQFLAMLSHELRNPLAAVLNATKLMQLEQPDDSPAAKARGIIERQSRHMARLLDDLLDVSRITRGDIELRKEGVDLRRVITAAVEAVFPLLEERKSELIASSHGGPLGVNGDPARLQQVVGNLLSNAARYSPPGSRIWLSASAVGESVLLKVRDEGCGVQPEMLSEIFELFVQADQGLDRPRGGLGVGLTLVRNIVELHGGEVEARSDGPGTGCEFVVRLPRQPLPVAAPRGESAPPPGRGRRVVIVEDQEDARDVLRLLLEAKGHSVVEAPDGASAIEAIAREHPEVALIDIGLPVINGYEVARAVRANRELSDVVLVALSGYGSEDDVQIAREAGFDDHLTKPAEPERIDALLRRHDRRQGRPGLDAEVG